MLLNSHLPHRNYWLDSPYLCYFVANQSLYDSSVRQFKFISLCIWISGAFINFLDVGKLGSIVFHRLIDFSSNYDISFISR